LAGKAPDGDEAVRGSLFQEIQKKPISGEMIVGYFDDFLW
jgi:hypothetical protein